MDTKCSFCGMTSLISTRSASSRAPAARSAAVALTGSWARWLQLEEVRPHDNFLELGGDSLRPAYMLLDVQETWGIEISLDVFFSTDSLHEFVLLIDSSLAQPATAPAAES